MILGSMVALVTPMLSNGAVDYESLDELLSFHIQNKTDAIVPVGTTGESPTLTPAEQLRVIEQTVKFIAGRIPVVAGTGSNSTAEAYEMTEQAAKLGVDACLVVVPYYNRPTQNGLIQHFEFIAKRVDVPLILYDVPSRTSCSISNETVAHLSKTRNIIGIKDATGDISRASALLKLVPSNFALYSGDDDSSYDFLHAGGHGVISVTANVLPNEMHQLCQAIREGRLDDAKQINKKLNAVNSLLGVEVNPIPVKYLLSKMGFINNILRLPLTPLSDDHKTLLDDALESFNY